MKVKTEHKDNEEILVNTVILLSKLVELLVEKEVLTVEDIEGIL